MKSYYIKLYLFFLCSLLCCKNVNHNNATCLESDEDCQGVCFGEDLSCYGCMDSLAINFDSQATINANICLFTDSQSNKKCGNQSTMQCFYFFESVKINDQDIDSLDYVFAMFDTKCIGIRNWDLSQCNGMCDLPVMGNDGSIYTEGYINNNSRPEFYIYDHSLNKIYSTITKGKIIIDNEICTESADENPEKCLDWQLNGFILIEDLVANKVIVNFN